MPVNLPSESELRNILLKLDEDYLLGRITKKEYDQKKSKIEGALKLLRLEADVKEGRISQEEYESRQAALLEQVGDLSEIVAGAGAPSTEQPPTSPSKEIALAGPREEVRGTPSAPSVARTSIPSRERSVEAAVPTKPAEIPSTLEGLVAELEELDAKRKKLSDLFKSGEISDETFVNMFLDYKKRRETLVSRLQSVEGEVEERLSDLLSELEGIEGRLELLKARAALGEIDRSAYEEERGQLEVKKREVERELSLLRKALDRISSRG